MLSDNPEFNTLEMAEDAIERMTTDDVIKLKLYARATFVITPSDLSEDDLLNDSLVRTLEGDRRWNKKLSILQHLIGVMKSIASDQRRKKVTKVEIFSEELSDTEQGVCFRDSTMASATQIIQYEQFLTTLFEMFKGDNHALILIKGFVEGYKRKETINLHNLTDNEYGSARRRITRKLTMEDI